MGANSLPNAIVWVDRDRRDRRRFHKAPYSAGTQAVQGLLSASVVLTREGSLHAPSMCIRCTGCPLDELISLHTFHRLLVSKNQDRLVKFGLLGCLIL